MSLPDSFEAGARDVFLGVDFGGTSVKVGLVDGAGRIRGKRLLAPPYAVRESAAAAPCADYDAFCSQLASFAAQALPGCAPAGVGVAVPGVVEKTALSLAPNAPLDLDALLGALSGAFPQARVSVLNDANAAAVGEHWTGAARGYDNALVVTVGTGIGAGVILDGALRQGAHGGAGEIGHLCVEPDGAACGCGRRGCLERYASASGLVRLYRLAGGEASAGDARAVFSALAAGEEAARTAVQSFAAYLGRGLAQAASVVDPDIIVVGGGVSESGGLFMPLVERAYRQSALAPMAAIPLVAAHLGNDAGFMGAARSVMVTGAR